MSDNITKCEHCKKEGRRPRMYPAPEGWLFMEVGDDSAPESPERLIVAVCSKECADKLWQVGPGTRWTLEEVLKA